MPRLGARVPFQHRPFVSQHDTNGNTPEVSTRVHGVGTEVDDLVQALGVGTGPFEGKVS